MNKLLILVFLTLTLYLHASAQTGVLTGKVFTVDNIGLRNAEISLVSFIDSSIVSSTKTNKDGHFKLGNIQYNRYRLLIEHKKYVIHMSRVIEISPRGDGTSYTMEDIILTRKKHKCLFFRNTSK